MLQAEAEEKQCSLIQALADITRDVSRGICKKPLVEPVRTGVAPNQSGELVMTSTIQRV